MRRIYLTLIIILSVASLATATFVAAQKAARPKSKAAPQKSSGKGKGTQPVRDRTASASGVTLRKADPNRAPQAAVDGALYSNEEFFGSSASVARPYADALERVTGLESKYPKDAGLRLNAARLAERLGRFDQAAAEMAAYADLKGRSPDALRRLANFYDGRARYADEVKTLRELASALPVGDRATIYRRAASLVRSRSLQEFKPADFFAELTAADPSNIQPVKDYVEELRLAKRSKDALAVLESVQPRFPAELGYFLKTRALILSEAGDRHGAEEVYSAAFDPNWPHAVAADYYELLRRFGRYRIVRRGLQEQVRGGAKDLQTAGRLFSIYAYEGNYAQAARLLADFEARGVLVGQIRNVSNIAVTQEPDSSSDNSAGHGPSLPEPDESSGPPASNGIALQGDNLRPTLEKVAAMYSSIGHYDQASRYLYTLYLSGGLEPKSKERENALYRIFKVMLDASGTPTRVAGGDLSFYQDIAEVDQHPGFMNGVLSLILSGTNPSQEFAAEEKAAAGYFNRTFAYRIFTAFKEEFPRSEHLGEMYLGVVNIFSGLGEHKLAIEAGREFQQRFPDSPSYVDVTLRIADSLVALKDRTGERAELARLLDRLAAAQPKGLPLVPISAKHWSYGPGVEHLIDRIFYKLEAYSDTWDPSQPGDDAQKESDTEADSEDSQDSESSESPEPGESSSKSEPNYSSVLERYVSSLAAEDKKTETVAFFWGEVRKHSKEEGLYERFLRWLGQAQLLNEQLKAYNSAIREFDSNTWHHRLARWYVRQKRGRELSKYSRQLIDIFDEEEITEYLVRFAGYGAGPEGDELNWDERLAFDLYSYAHTHFPRNLFFVRGMVTYLERNDRPRWEKLSAEYYFADRSIREPYLAWLSKQSQLRDRLKQARLKTPPAPGSAPEAPLAYPVFAADAAAWLSHHDEALDAYRRLVALYPGEPQYAARLSDIARSLGQTSDKLYEEAARVCVQMADIHPSDHPYRIKAGEIYAQMGDFKRAGEQWNKLLALEPGARETYLEVATVFWDYYQYDESIRALKQLRDVTGDPNVYAYRLGAVYEGKGNIDSAIAEYVKVLPEPGQGRDTVTKRLAQLSKRKGLPEKIAASYQSAHSQHPDDWQLVVGYATYEAEREHVADALAMLRTEVSRSTDVAFLESVRDLFQFILRPEDQQMVSERLAAVARDERESMMYRLQLASFLERQRKSDAAIAVIDKLVADYPTNVGAIEESSQFYWRAGMRDRSIDLIKRTLARARGTYRRTLTLQLARRQVDAAKLSDAEATLRAFYAENRGDDEVLGELAYTLRTQNKLSDLAALYQEGFKDVRAAGLGGDETRSRIASLRDGMIRTLTGLGKFEDAVDQHIELINAFPEDEDRVLAAMEFAEKHNLTNRLTGYYEKLSKESFKNYRWQVVLGRLYERQGNLAGASDQYRIAVVNEPQRPDLRLALASTLTRQRRYDDAIATLREGWTLSGRDPQWLVEVARIQVRQGLRDAATETMRQALAAKQNAKIAAQLTIASQLASWGLHSEAVRIYDESFAKLPKTMKEDYVSADQVTGYVKALIRVEPALPAFQKLERMRTQYQAIAQNSQDTDGYKARAIIATLDQALRSDFGKGVIDYSTASETAAFADAVRVAAQKFASYPEAEQMRRYLGIARSADLVEVEEQIQSQLKDAAFKARTKPEDEKCYTELRALVTFYNRHASYARAAEVMGEEMKRDPYKGRFDYQNQIAVQYRLAGDQARELESLRAAYAGASGDLNAGNTDWVDRYLTLLYDTGKRPELQRLTLAYSPYQLQLINFLVEKNEKEMSLNALIRARQQPAWVSSRSGEIGLFLKDTSAETEEFFKTALDLRPIGQMIGRRVDRNRTLAGDDWFVAARNYAYWLGIVGRENDSRKLVVAEIEGHPATARAQLEVAAFYLERKNAPRAGEHVALAAELAPNEPDTIVMQGSTALARGDRKAAVEAWARLINDRSPLSNATTYAKVMAANGFLHESLPTLENYLVAYVVQVTKESANNDHIDAVKPLVREISERARSDSRLAAETAAFFQRVISRTPEDLVIGRLLIAESLLPEAQLSGIYRLMHQRLTNKGAAVAGTEEYEKGYWSGTEVFYPGRELADWRHRILDYLIRTRSFDEARLLLAEIKQEQGDMKLGTAEGALQERYEWLPLASALIELRSERDASKGVAALRHYCGLDASATEGSSGLGSLHEHCLKAYALLIAEHREADADALLYEAYRQALGSRHPDDAVMAGLAEIEARRGRGEEAGRLLKLLTERSVDNPKALQLAAETASRVGRYSDAAAFREQLALANPNDATNRLELARALAAGGQTGEAVSRIVTLIGERTTPNSVRAQAAEVIGELVRTDRSVARQQLLDQLAAQTGEGSALVLAAIDDALGKTGEARTLLSGITRGPLGAVAQMKLGQLASAQGRDSEAAVAFERSLNLDADGSVTDAIAFRVPGLRGRLIEVYGRAGRDLAALRLAEGDGGGQRSLITPAVRAALAAGAEHTEQAPPAAFEPSLELARPKGPGMKTLAEMNEAASSAQQQRVLATLAESAARLGQYDRAVAIQRVRAMESAKPEEKASIEKRLAEFVAADNARRLRIQALLRVSRANTTGSIYASRFLGGG